MRFFPLMIAATLLIQGCKKDMFTETLDNSQPMMDLGAGEQLFNPANTKALIVGVLAYEDPNLESFSTYHRKDKELMDELINYGVPNENIIGLFDEAATRENIYKALHHIAIESDEETNFIFYFAGHGFNGWYEDASSIYFANYDIKYIHPDKTGFNINYLTDKFRLEFPGNSIFLMADCCKSGGLVNVAQEFGDYGYQSVAITSCFYTDWSTGNWTFTQKMIDAFKGDGLIDMDHDGAITLNETMQGVARGLKYIDRQKSSSADFNCSADAKIKDVATMYSPTGDDTYATGQYVFGKVKKNYHTIEITGKTGDQFEGRYYNYADYVTFYFDAADLKVPHFVHYDIDADVLIDNFTDYPADLLAEADDFYEMYNAVGGQTVWHLYERIISDDEIPALILDPDGAWVNGQILEQSGDNYYVTYTGKGYQWDEWVSSDHVDF